MNFSPVYFLWHIILATLLIIGLYSLAVGIKARERSFLFYTAYSFLLLIFVSLKGPYNSENFNTLIYNSSLNIAYWYIQMIYNLLYFWFFIHFLDVNSKKPVFSKRLSLFLKTMLFLGTGAGVLSLLLQKTEWFAQFFAFFFTPLAFLAALFVLIKTFTIPGKLKYFFITGSTFYLIFAVFSLVWSKLGSAFDATSFWVPMAFFYLGIFLEQLAFGLGLSYKVHLIHQQLIEASRKNEQIKHEMNKKLQEQLKAKERDLLKMARKAQKDRIRKLKNDYEYELNKVQLSSLQNKMNPHFIFNALNSIKVFLIENDKEMAVQYMNHFSKLVRKILESSRVEQISLKEELEILRLYVNIESNRFEDDIQFNPPQLSDKQSKIVIPPLILQPFIENALWHGLAPSSKTKKIDLGVEENSNTTVLRITDNGVGRAYSYKKKARKPYKKRSLGLKITAERIDLFNKKQGVAYTWKIIDLKDETGKPAGTEVKFFLKKQ